MNEFLRDRILRKLEQLPDDRAYQVLDFVEFMESKYAQKAEPASNLFQRFAEGVEDRLRAGKVSANTIAETMGLMNRAMGVLNGVAAAGKSVADDLAGVAQRASAAAAPNSPPAAPTTPPASPPMGAAPVVPPSSAVPPTAPHSPPGEQRQ
jgi:hypothetical protein